MSDDLVREIYRPDGILPVTNETVSILAIALTEARAEIERLNAQVDEALRSCLAEREGRLKAEAAISTLRARVLEVVGPLVDACEADCVGEVCKDEDPNESVALGENGPSALTFGMIYAARQLMEEVK